MELGNLSLFRWSKFLVLKKKTGRILRAKCKNCNWHQSAYTCKSEDVRSVRLQMKYHVIYYNHEVEYEYKYAETIGRKKGKIEQSYFNEIKHLIKRAVQCLK